MSISEEKFPRRDICSSLVSRGIPALFHQHLIPDSDIDKLEQLKSKSDGETWLVSRRSSGIKLIFKEIPCDPADFPAIVASTLAVNFYFLSPCVGFACEQQRGLYFRYHEGSRTLRDLLEKSEIPANNKMLVAALVCFAMAYLEAGCLVHGALNSDNVLLDSGFVPIVTDYGLGRRYAQFCDGKAHDELGWVAPEIVNGSNAHYSVDVFSYGALLFEMFEGRRPFANLSNGELLAGIREQKLKLRFDKTPANIQAMIRSCMDVNPNVRPSFAELYESFRSQEMSFEGVEVLSHYPYKLVFQEGERAEAVAGEKDAVDGLKILADPAHRQFDEYVQFLCMAIKPGQVKGFCDAVAKHVAKGQSDAGLVQFLLGAVAEISRRGDKFLAGVVQSCFLSMVHVTTDVQADILLDIVLPVFQTQCELFSARMYKAVAQLMLFHPDAMLNLFSLYFSRVVFGKPDIEKDVLLFLHLTPLLADTDLGENCIKLAMFLRARCPRVASDVEQLLHRFSTATNSKTATVAKRYLAMLHASSESMDEDAMLSLCSDPASIDYAISLILNLKQIPVCEKAIPYLAAKATDPDRRAWAVLMKYALTSEAHAKSMLSDCSWMEQALPTIEDTFRLLLAIFKNPSLRPLGLQKPECHRLITNICAKKDVNLMRGLSALRTSFSSAVLSAWHETGLIMTIFRATLEADSDEMREIGLLIVDALSRSGYTSELNDVVPMCINISRTSPKLSQTVVRVLAVLSVHRHCMALMRKQGLVEYFTKLSRMGQPGQFSDAINYFLSNASKFA